LSHTLASEGNLLVAVEIEINEKIDCAHTQMILCAAPAFALTWKKLATDTSKVAATSEYRNIT
jgi:hypothetical protein